MLLQNLRNDSTRYIPAFTSDTLPLLDEAAAI
jgi:hypothetical protein